MVNWDPKALTALSDEEVIYKEEHSKLYYLRYKIVGEEGYAIVATTRPETIMGDTAMCINPNDPKNQHLRGKKVIVPLVGREIPVIEDDYVDIEFGTGCLKVTPAHDVNDYMLGEKYNLPSIDIFNDNGTLSEAAGLYVGMDRFDVRKQIEEDLRNAGLWKGRGLREQGGFLGAYERAYRTEIVYAMVLEDGTSSPDRLGAGHEGRYQVLSAEVQEHLPPLDGEYQGLVYQPSALVGTPYPGLLLAGRWLRGSRDGRESFGTGEREMW